MNPTGDIKQKAIELGFDLAGVTDAAAINAEHAVRGCSGPARAGVPSAAEGPTQAEVFAQWLQSGFAGQMAYMHRNLQKRLDPAKLLPNARSVIVVGLNYTLPRQEPEAVRANGPAGRVAHYARYEDYHPFMKERLNRLVDFLASFVGGDFRFKVCVDSAPLAERALAVRAGLGFIGKNHMLINPELGCEIFLGEIVTDLELPPDAEHAVRVSGGPARAGVPSAARDLPPIAGRCGGCTRCLDACPTGALRTDGQFDAGRCINYLTIEHKGPVAPELACKIGDRLLGCDECVLACPYQNAAPVCRNRQFRFHADRAKLNLKEVLDLTPESFEARFADSPIRRAGLDGLKRNAAICLANTDEHWL